MRTRHYYARELQTSGTRFFRFLSAEDREAWLNEGRNAHERIARMVANGADAYDHPALRRDAAGKSITAESLWESVEGSPASRFRDLAAYLPTLPGKTDLWSELRDFPEDAPFSGIGHEYQWIASRLAKHPAADRPATLAEIGWDLGMGANRLSTLISRIYGYMARTPERRAPKIPSKDRYAVIVRAWRESVALADLAELEEMMAPLPPETHPEK